MPTQLGVFRYKSLRTSIRLPLAVALLFFAGFAPSCFAAGSSQAPCTQQMLDIRVLPPMESDSGDGMHSLAIEFENRGKQSCQLQPVLISLDPMGGADSLTNAFFSDRQSSPGELEFQKNQNELNRGDVAHILIAWKSKSSLMVPGCANRDGLTLTLGTYSPAKDSPPPLKIEHLWMHFCDRVYVSNFRSGHYAGEPVTDDWLKRFQASASDFAAPIFGSAQPKHERPVALITHPYRHMLTDFFPLYLDLPRINYDCPYVILRKRESDGSTKVYVDNCTATHATEGTPHGNQTYPWGADTRQYTIGMNPEKLGAVEYEAITHVLEDDNPVYATAHLTVTMHDPIPPGLPSIDSFLPECQSSQLTVSRLTVLRGGKFHDAHVYEATNSSKEGCRIGGVPQISVPHPVGISYTADHIPCPNCSDSLFLPRPNGWIDLPSAETAHFLVGASRYGPETGRWQHPCDSVEELRLSLA